MLIKRRLSGHTVGCEVVVGTLKQTIHILVSQTNLVLVEVEATNVNFKQFSKATYFVQLLSQHMSESQ